MSAVQSTEQEPIVINSSMADVNKPLLAAVEHLRETAKALVMAEFGREAWLGVGLSAVMDGDEVALETVRVEAPKDLGVAGVQEARETVQRALGGFLEALAAQFEKSRSRDDDTRGVAGDLEELA
ncbi:MAG: hypothetical protein KDK03_10980 [Rhodobacteraceae bacterium]|nr:hypothetical protein [Paracoccaceae bacterium]